MAVTALTITERRENVVDFAVPFMYYSKEMLLMKKESARIDLLQFADPFHENVWYTLLACIVIISGAVFVLNYFSPYGYKDENGRGTSWEFSFPNSVWFSLSCMLQQGEDKTPKSLSGGGPKLACHEFLCSPSWKLSQIVPCDVQKSVLSRSGQDFFSFKRRIAARLWSRRSLIFGSII